MRELPSPTPPNEVLQQLHGATTIHNSPLTNEVRGTQFFSWARRAKRADLNQDAGEGVTGERGGRKTRKTYEGSGPDTATALDNGGERFFNVEAAVALICTSVKRRAAR